MFSFWERQSFLTYDYIIIGSGIVGLSTAATIKEQRPTASVLVLERGIFPTGASTKNAGFACIGSLTELLADLQTMSCDEVIALVAQRQKGLFKLRQRLGDKALSYKEHGSYELIFDNELPCLDQLAKVNQLLYPLLKGNAFTLVNEKIADFGFSCAFVKAMVQNNFEGQLNTGKMMKSLLAYVQSLGVTIINGATVKGFEDTQQGVTVSVHHTTQKELIPFSTKRLVICTNAFTRQFFPNLDLSPGRGQVLVTQPISFLPFKGIFHFEEGYYYFRNIGDRVIFGGGRNLDFKSETTTEFAANQSILEHLKEKLHAIILPNTPFEIDMNWSGIMAFGKHKKPLIQQVSPNVVLGVRLSGMGIAIGSNLGEQLAALAIFD